jgi:hypothetical protein
MEFVPEVGHRQPAARLERGRGFEDMAQLSQRAYVGAGLPQGELLTVCVVGAVGRVRPRPGSARTNKVLARE